MYMYYNKTIEKEQQTDKIQEEEKMKFFYNGKQVRTSKTHLYTHGLVNTKGKVVSCHGSKEAAEKAFDKLGVIQREWIRNGMNAIKALEAGKSYYISTTCRVSYKESLAGKTAEDFLNTIEKAKRILEEYSHYQIVELEARD